MSGVSFCTRDRREALLPKTPPSVGRVLGFVLMASHGPFVHDRERYRRQEWVGANDVHVPGQLTLTIRRAFAIR